MFPNVFGILTLASLTCAGYLQGYSSNYDNGYANANFQYSWPNTYGYVGRHLNSGLNYRWNRNSAWNYGQVGSVTGRSNYGVVGKYFNSSPNAWIGYNSYGGATSYANSKLQSFGNIPRRTNYDSAGRYSNSGLNGWIRYANSNVQSYDGYGYRNYDKYNKYGDYNNYDRHSYPRYGFAYGVNDLQTGDQKFQQEQRDGDKVRGSYGLKEADGTTREVRYTADDRNGFNAVVTRNGVAHHPY